MPRNGSGIYSVPAGTYGVPNGTVYSGPYNANVDDVATDLNTPRPIVAGGTGASTPRDALIALGAEMALQAVTNYNATPFLSGSFVSAPGATGAPTAAAFKGQAVVYDSNNITLVAYDLAASEQYVRTMSAGVWGAWSSTSLTLANKVAKTGDTMTGALTINANSNALKINSPPILSNSAVNVGFNNGAYGGVELHAKDTGASAVYLAFANAANSVVGSLQTDAAQAVLQTTGQWSFTNGTASSSPSTGALTVAGGVGVGGALNVGAVTISGVGPITAALNIGEAGGFGSNAAVNLRYNSSGGAGIEISTSSVATAGNLISFVNGTGTFTNGITWGGSQASLVFDGLYSFSSTAASTSPTTGALTVAGGVGVGGVLSAGGAVGSTRDFAAGAHFDSSGAVAKTIANGASLAVAASVGSGFLMVSEVAVDGDVALYILGINKASLIFSQLGHWVDGLTPAAGKMSFAYDGTSAYRIYNNQGAAISVRAALFRVS